jgi:hypothetical protein
MGLNMAIRFKQEPDTEQQQFEKWKTVSLL